MELPITPYGLLTDEQKQYLEDNLSYVEIYCSQGWCRKSGQHFCNANAYRVNKPLTNFILTSEEATLLKEFLIAKGY